MQPTPQPQQLPTWQEALSDLIACPEQLSKLMPRGAASPDLGQLKQTHQLFPIRLPRSYWQRLQQLADPTPVLRQFLPAAEELIAAPGYTADPLEEEEANKIPGLLHKYSSRVLLTVTKSCAVHCRYCFRRHFNYTENTPGRAGWRQAMAYIQAHPEVQEVIFSGGDPLSLNDNYLQFLVDELQQIPHVKTIRLHTRMPAILPQRITDELIDVFAKSNKKRVMVVHINHPDEIDKPFADAMEKLQSHGWTLLNQAVMLSGVNAQLETLVELSNRLFQSSVLPYYLHLPDKVLGTHHFDVVEAKAVQLYQQLQSKLPGYLVPQLVREIPGKSEKTRI